MRIRKLIDRDSHRMLEWIKEPSINRFFRWDSDQYTLESTVEFIRKTSFDKNNIHLAVVDDSDMYMGTISLKNIDLENKNAEYAISFHNDAIGKGYAKDATTQILNYAFIILGLEKVYLNVRDDNIRAMKFYKKYGFIYEGKFVKHLVKNGIFHDLIWFRILREEFLNIILGKDNIVNLIKINYGE